MYFQAQEALGGQAKWTKDPRETFDGICEEWPPVMAASLMEDAGIVQVVDEPWTDEDIRDWYAQAMRDGSVDYAWMALRLAATRDLRLVPTDDDLDMLGRAAGTDAVPQLYLHDIAQAVATDTNVHPTTSPVDLSSQEQNLRVPQDAATLMLRAAALGDRPSSLGQEAVNYALTGVASSDITYSRIVQAYVLDGDAEAARQADDLFNTNRVMPDRQVLESPLFNGSPRSTFYMLRYFDAQGGMDSWLSPDVQDRVASALWRASESEDAGIRVAAVAALSVLRPGEVTTEQRAAAVAAVQEAAGIGSAAMDSDRTLGWIQIAVFAEAMGVTLRFPGIHEEVLQEWLSYEPEESAYGIARLLIAVDASDDATALSGGAVPEKTSSAARLSDSIEAVLTAERLSDVPSSILFPGVLALLTSGVQLPYGTDDLLEEINTRSGGCLGGYSGFIREQRATNTVCSADISYYAERLRKEIL